MVVNIFVIYCLRKIQGTETEETICFFVTFLSLAAFQFGGGGAGPPLATLMIGSAIAR